MTDSISTNDEATSSELRDQRARRRRSGAVTVASLAVGAAAVLGGAAVSADAMPGDSPTSTETATFGKIETGPDGTFSGFECTLSGEQLARIEVVDASAAIPADAQPLPEGLELEASATIGRAAVAEPLPAGAVADEVVVGADGFVSADGDHGAFAEPLPNVRQGTAEECAALIDEVGLSGR